MTSRGLNFKNAKPNHEGKITFYIHFCDISDGRRCTCLYESIYRVYECLVMSSAHTLHTNAWSVRPHCLQSSHIY